MGKEIVLIFEKKKNWAPTWKFDNSNDNMVSIQNSGEVKKYKVNENNTVNVPVGTVAIVFKWDAFPKISLILQDKVEGLVAIHANNSQEFNDHKGNIKEGLKLSDNILLNAIQYTFGDTPDQNHPVYKFAEEIAKGTVENIKAAFTNLLEYVKKKLNEAIGRKTLCRFLPLVIDMQAFRQLLNEEKEEWENEENKERKKESMAYLKEMLGDVEDDFFVNKLKDAKKNIEGITDENYRQKLDALFDDKRSYIYNFLTLLDKQKKEGLTEGNLQDTQYRNVITLFHGWYVNLLNVFCFST